MANGYEMGFFENRFRNNGGSWPVIDLSRDNRPKLGSDQRARYGLVFHRLLGGWEQSRGLRRSLNLRLDEFRSNLAGNERTKRALDCGDLVRRGRT